MKKFFITLFLSLSLLTIALLGVSAAELTVGYSVDGRYTVKIPEYLEADTNGEILELSEVVIPFGQELSVSANYDGELQLENEPSIILPYNLLVNNSEYTSGTVFIKKEAGDPNGKFSVQLSAKVTEKPLYAGMYRSLVTFDIQIQEVTETDYSPEDIEKDSHLFAIGSTKPEYVVARFNDDFSSVIITKNGADSDGKMRGWNKPTSPFSENRETLTTVSVKPGVATIGSTAFMNCTNVKEISLPDGIKEIGDSAFYDCSALQNIYLSDDIHEINSYAFMGCSALEQVVLPKDLTEIADCVFSDCSSLTSIIIGEKVTKIELAAFSDCSSLKSIDLPPNLQSIDGWAFSSCSSLESITIPDSVKTLGGLAFRECRNLTEIHLPNGITELSISLFDNCESLTQIDIPNTVKKIGIQVFYGCKSISELYIPENVTELEWSALSGLVSLTAFTVAENNTALCAEDGVLYNKDKTQLLYFPRSKNTVQYTVPESVTEICANCFGSCKYLRDIYVGTQVTTVAKYMFDTYTRPLVHTPTGSAMEQFCIENDVAYDNIMQ